ncbi:MAG TPA: hypothetical protein VEC38_06955 [Candidatus Binataceae bacterium]|nr:hypothetical protein [Candidatus Binataceae bacterium]
MIFKVVNCSAIAAMAFVAAGCFDPPISQPPPEAKTVTVIGLPYDLAWEAVGNVISQDGLHVQVQDPVNGIIEAQGKGFSLQDADCGRIHSVLGAFAAQPDAEASAVYNFRLKTVGNEASSVAVRATFNSPLRVPLRPVRDVECVSRGTQESRLLREVLAQASQTHPPQRVKPEQAALPPKPASPPLESESPPLTSGRPTLLKPDFLLRPGPE